VRSAEEATRKAVTRMSNTRPEPEDTSLSAEELAVSALYRQIIDGWNQHSADVFAGAFAEGGEAIGFDGSRMIGRDEIATTLGQIFADHVTAPYVAKVKGVRLVSAAAAILSAIVGMVPAGAMDINPALNALQTVVAGKREGGWQVELMQTTPAQFHGRPEEVERMTEELRRARLQQESMSEASGK
jgi:uncharacterized protein (TIGR02246 family)